MKEKKKLSLAAQIFIALVLAVIAGLLMQKYANFAETYIKPFGTIFLNLLKFIVVPIVLFSIMCGIISMKDIKRSDRSEQRQSFTICVRQHLPLHSDLLGQICSKEHFRRLRQQIFLIKQIRRSH